MADLADEREARTEAPSTFGSWLRFVGPGLIIAATGVGAGDMVSSLNAGTEYGMIFLWAILVGAFIKFYLTEGIGRWYMATGQTILRGWRSLGRFVSGFFVVYLLILTFVFGARRSLPPLWRSARCFRSSRWRPGPCCMASSAS